MQTSVLRPIHSAPIVFCITSVLALGSAACAPSSELAPAGSSITADDLRRDLYFLGSDAMAGRLTDTPENALAAQFIEARFRGLQLQPAVDGSYFQPYDLNTFSLGADNRIEIIGIGPRLLLAPGEEFVPQQFSGNGTASGPVVFAGYGIVSDALGWDDYGNADIADKIVLVVDHEPGEENPDSLFDGLVTAEAARNWRKAIYAQQRGAAAILFVRDIQVHGQDEDFDQLQQSTWPARERRIERYSLASWMNQIDIPAAMISAALAADLLAAGGQSLTGLLATVDADSPSSPIDVVGPRVTLTTNVERTRVPDRNVVAMIEGSDPGLSHELVIVGAHYDHNGADGNTIYNGADDDGSGIVGLLEIAEAYALAARDGQRPRRSVLFAAWNSEERGLLGAWAYTENPLRPLPDTVATLNMDMIGRNEEVPAGDTRRFRGLEPQTAESNSDAVHIMAYSFSSSLRESVQRLNEASDSAGPIALRLELEYDNNASNLLRRSDQWPFLQRGVPSLFFHTGLHPDYHRETDTPDRINYEKMERIARLVHRMSWELANADERPALDERTGTL